MLTETRFISEFDVRNDGIIHVCVTTQIHRNNVVIHAENWRCVLERNDARASEVLANEPFFLDLAQYVWSK